MTEREWLNTLLEDSLQRHGENAFSRECYATTSVSGQVRAAGEGLPAASDRSGTLTAAHYVEIKARPVLGFGHLLKKEGRSIVPIDRAKTA